PNAVRVVSVTPADGATIPAQGKTATVAITIAFDKKLKKAVLDPGSVRVVGFRKGKPVQDAAKIDAKSFKYDDAKRTLTVSGTLQVGADLEYHLTVRGKGAKRVQDVDDLALDGNADGTPGGNFTSTFRVESRRG